MELNAEQIIKALECLTGEEVMFCRECVYNGVGAFSCKKELAKDALALIKELTEVVERSETARGCNQSIDNGFSPSVTELQRENERLRADVAKEFTCVFGTSHKVSDCPIDDEVAKTKADTVRKMHSMLCEGRVSNDNVVIVANQIAKEMLEGNNDND